MLPEGIPTKPLVRIDRCAAGALGQARTDYGDCGDSCTERPGFIRRACWLGIALDAISEARAFAVLGGNCSRRFLGMSGRKAPPPC